MRKILTIIATAGLFSTVALAGTWTGQLVDATCMSQQNQGAQQNQQQNQGAQQNQQQTGSACNPTEATSNFAIMVNGQLLNLDSSGNQKAQSAIQNRASRAQNQNEQATGGGPVNAKVTGTQQGNTIKTQSVTLE